MIHSTRTFRIFVSSTFTDMKAERNALQEQVFPRLRSLAAAHGCRFQAIDLRWGVSNEASLDQQTMKICLSEIERCQKVSPRPNFIVLLGDRYGWCPLPEEIPADEYTMICTHIHSGDVSLLDEWYRLDENAVPPVYCLLPRTGAAVEYSVWEQVERRLHTCLKMAVTDLPIPIERKIKYCASATEQEIFHGALQVQDASKHVFGFFRSIADLPVDSQAMEFRDLDLRGAAETEYAGRLHTLKQDLKRKLGRNIHEYNAHWSGNGITTDHIAQLCDDVYNDLSAILKLEIDLMEDVDPLDNEIAEHNAFAVKRAHTFVGRDNLLTGIQDYMDGSSRVPLVLWGSSGTGKSSLLARTLFTIEENHPDVCVIARFVGATPDSTDQRSLLKCLCQQIYREFDFDAARQERLESEGDNIVSYVHFMYGESETISIGADVIEKEYTIPEDPLLLSLTFLDFLKKIPTERHLVLVLDAIDQLEGIDIPGGLSWFPTKLPENVHMIVSVTPGSVMDALSNRLPAKNIFELPPLSSEEGLVLLNIWLDEAGRTLQPKQVHAVILPFSRCGLPIYLKLAFEQVRSWRSYHEHCTLSVDTNGIIRDLFGMLSQESFHGQVLINRFLAYLSSSRFGLTEDELLDLFAADAEVMSDFQRRSPRSPISDRLPVVVWSRLFFDLEPYLTERTGDGTRLLTFFHRQLAEVARQDYLANAAETERHRALAEYFAAQPLEMEKDGRKAPNRRRFTELAFQQTQAGMWQELAGTLCDLRSIQLECASGMTYRLVQDSAIGLAALPEAQDEARLEKETQERLAAYAQALAETLSGSSLPQPPKVPQLNIFHLGDTVKRIVNEPTRLDKMRAFNRFLDSQAHHLVKHASVPMFTIQEAYNSASWGPVHDAAEAILRESPNTPAFLRLKKSLPNFLAFPTQLRTMGGGNREIHCAAITPDGRFAFTGGSSNVYLWDLSSGACLLEMDSPGFDVTKVCITPDGRLGASTDTKEVCMWDLQVGRCIRTIPYIKSQGDVLSMEMSANGKLLLTSGFDQIVRLWEVEGGGCQEINIGDPFNFACLSPDGRYIAITSSDGLVRFYALDESADLDDPDYLDGSWHLDGRSEGNLPMPFQCNNNPVNVLALSTDGRRALAVAESRLEDGDYRLFVYDLENCENLETLEGHSYVVNDLALSADGSLAASVDLLGNLMIWETRSGIIPSATIRHPSGEIKSVSLRADGGTIVTVNSDGTLSIWDLMGVHFYFLGFGEETLVAGELAPLVLPNGHTCVTTQPGENPNPILWDIHKFEIKSELQGHIGKVERMWLDLTGSRLLTYHAILPDEPMTETRGVVYWNLENLSTKPIENYFIVDKRSITHAAVTPDEKRMVIASEKGTLTTWEIGLGVGKFLFKIELEDTVYDIQISPEGSMVLVAGGGYGPFKNRDAYLELYNLSFGRKEVSFNGHTRYVVSAKFTADGKHIVSASADGSVRLWDLEKGKELRCMDGYSFALSADGRRLLTRDKEWNFTLWDLQSGEPLGKLQGCPMGSDLLCLSPQGRIALTAGTDDVLCAWDTASGVCLAVMPAVKRELLGNKRQLFVLGSDMTAFDTRLPDLGIPIVTPVRLWLHSSERFKSNWDKSLSVCCDWCGVRFHVEDPHGGRGLFRKKRANEAAKSGVLTVIDCPVCHQELTLSPFVMDRRPRF